MSQETVVFWLEDLPNNVDLSLLSGYLEEKIKKKPTSIDLIKEKNRAKVIYTKTDLPDISVLDEIDDTSIPNTKLKVKIGYTEVKGSVLTHTIKAKDFKEDEEIKYEIPYTEHVRTQFIRSQGDDSLVFTDAKTMQNQRAIIQHLLSKIGSNILSGSGIMNVSLPINIFDQRSLLEVFAHQLRLSPYFLEKAGEETDPTERLKYVTAFHISRIHLSVTQLKPFNPIWGETFQCKIGDTLLYLEQTSHHPPIYNFLHLGKNFKAYGYQKPEASTGTNSITGRTFGEYVIEFKDGSKVVLYPCELILSGTLIGDRKYSIVGKTYVVDTKNELASYIEFNPDTRGFFDKMIHKRTTFPDYFKGVIVRTNSLEENKSKHSFTLKPNVTPLVNIEGEWTAYCEFDNEKYWEYDDEKFHHFPLRRMSYTLQSDSSIREDSLYLKEGNEDKAGKAKVELEEIQRKDRKLRAKYAKLNK